MLLVSIISLILFSGPDKPEKELRAREPAHESSIYFRRDKSNYQDSYLGNTDAADKLLALLLEIGTENVDSVTVTAYASPDAANSNLYARVIWAEEGVNGSNLSYNGGDKTVKFSTRCVRDVQ